MQAEPADDLPKQVRIAQAQTMLDGIGASMIANCFIAATAAAILYVAGYGTPVVIWFASIVGINAVRMIITVRLRRTNAAERTPDHALSVLTLGAFLGGLLWAIPSILPASIGTGHADTSNVHAYVIFIICGICAGAVIQSRSYARTAMAFAVPPMLLTIFTLLATGDEVQWIIASDVLLLLVMMARSSRHSEEAFVASQRDRLEAVSLAGSLSKANDDIRDSNVKLAVLANCDPLTGLGNRAAFNMHLRRLVEEPKAETTPVALMIIDLDRFKSINDTMGHGAGDRVLTEFARRLTSASDAGTLVSRLGGDEFAVLIEGENAAARATEIGHRIMALTVTPVMIGDRPVTVGSSAGLALYPDHGGTAEDLFASADIALYAAKDQGRRCVCLFNPEIRRRIERQKTIEIGLEDAIARGEVHAVFQPQVELSNRAIIGFEALVRWTHPVLGPIAPPEIVQAAHSIHAAATLTRHVARAAASLAVDLQRLGLGTVCVAVNVSPRELSSYSVSALLLDVVREAGITPAALEVEITEEAILDTETAGTELARLEASGFRLAVDDFGMGHSSLANLMHLRIDRLKIDRSFIHGIASSRQNQALISALVGIGHALAIEVVVEGVETPDDAEVLRMLGCRFAQGYLFGRPMQADSLPAWIEAHRSGPLVRSLTA